jgi:pyridoxamine 5'-phosphate oxidase
VQWQVLEAQLSLISTGSAADLNNIDVTSFQAIYQEHMQIEETQIAPMAMRLFSQEQMYKLGQAMQARRGIDAV